MRKKVARFLAHAKECAVTVKEGHSNLLDWGPLLGCCLVVFGPWVARLFSAEQGVVHGLLAWLGRNAWHISAAGLTAFVFVMFWQSFCKWDELSERLKPALNVQCAPGIEGSVVQACWSNRDVLFYRLVLSVGGMETVNACQGILQKIEKDGDVLWGPENAELTFAGDERESKVKSVHPKVPLFIDLLAITNHDEIYAGTPSREWLYAAPLDVIFASHGIYHITVAIKTGHPYTRVAHLKFTWFRKRETAELILDRLE